MSSLLKYILRFLGYLKGTNEISTTALARCEKAVKYFESKEDVSFIKKVEVLRKESDLSPMEIAFLMWNYDQIEIYVKLKKLLTNEQVLRFRPFDHQTQHQYCSNTGKVGTIAGIVRTSRSPSF